jgi:tetratricopeptide (TPR) repeat protein
VWVAGTGRRIAKMKHPHGVRWAAFSPDGRRLVSATGDFSGTPFLDLLAPQSDPGRLGEARVWDVATGRPITAPIRHEGVVLRASFSPDGRFLLTTCVSRAANRYQARVWDAGTGRPITPPLVHPHIVLHEAFSPDGKLVATGCGDGGARVWDAATGKALPVLARYGGPVLHVSFSPDARRLLTASLDGTARIWDAATGQLIARLDHGQPVQQAVFAADGYSVITGCAGATVRVWPLAPDHRPVDDWVALAELMAGGSRGRGRDEDWASTWRTLRGKYPGDFATTKTQQLAWHRAALEIATQKKAWSAALAHLTRLTEIDPDNWQDRLARARLLARLERWDEARAEFTRAVKRHAGVPAVWVARGSYFLGRGKRERAKADLIKAIDLRASPELPAVLSEFWVAGLYPENIEASFPPEAQLDPSRPIPALARPKADLPLLPRWRSEVTDVSGYLDLAACFDGAEHISAYALAYVYAKTEQEVALLTGSDDGVRLWLNGKLIHHNPAVRFPAPDQDCVPAKLRRGWNTVLAKVVNITGRHGLFLRLSSPDAGDSEFWYRKGVAHHDLQQWDKALACLNRSLDKGPKQSAAWHYRAAVHNALRRYEQALADADKAKELGDDSPWLRRHCAVALKGVGRTAEAMREISELLAAGPEHHSWALALRATWYVEQQKWREAADDFTRTFELDPQHPTAGTYAALLRLQSGDTAGYRKHCQVLLEHALKTRNPRQANNLVWVCTLAPGAVDDPKLLVERMEKAVKSDHTSWYYAGTLGAALYRAGRFDEAVRRIEGANKLQGKGGVPQDWLFLAMAHHRLRHAEQARKWLDQAVRAIKQADPKKPPTGARWSERIEIQLLRREAQTLIHRAAPKSKKQDSDRKP